MAGSKTLYVASETGLTSVDLATGSSKVVLATDTPMLAVASLGSTVVAGNDEKLWIIDGQYL